MNKVKVNIMGFIQSLLIILIGCYVFVAPLKGGNVILYTIILGIIFSVLYIGQLNYKFSFMISDSWLLVFVAICLISLIYTQVLEPSVNYCMVLILCVLLYFYFSKKDGWVQLFINVLGIIALINAGVTVFASLNYEAFIAIFASIMKENTLDMANRFKNVNAYSGILGQTGINANTIVMSVPIFIRNIKNSRNRLWNICCLFIIIWALFLTKKRGALLWMVSTILMVYFIDQKKEKKPILNKLIATIVILVVCIVIVYFSYNNIPIVAELLDRFNYIENENFTSGRSELTVQAIDVIKKYPIGVGIDAYASKYGMYIHNDFLQIAVEVGLIGLGVFLMFFLATLIDGIKVYVNSVGENNEMAILISLLLFCLLSCFTSYPIHTYSICIQIFVILAGIRSLSKNNS